MTPDLARYIMTLGFNDDDRARMLDLAARNQEGAVTAAERDELFNFIKAGHLLSLLHAKARKALRGRKRT